MSWLLLAVREWERRPLRTAVTSSGVAIAMAALFSLLAFERGYNQGLRDELDHLGAHILVVPKGCPYDAASIALHGASWPCYLKQQSLDEVRAVAGVATAAPVFMAALYGDGGSQVVYVGVETNILKLKPGWRIDGRFPERAGELLVGADVARQHRWVPGQPVDLPGLHDQRGVIAGILAATHGAEDTFIHLTLRDAQSRFRHPNELTHILVRLTDPDQLDHAVSQLRGCDAGMAMNVVPLAHVFHTIQSLVHSTRLLLGCLALIALLVAAAGVANSILMAVTERTRDIGVLRALGASRGDVFRLIWLETVAVCSSGALVGMAGAFLASRSIESWIRAQLPFAPATTLIHWAPVNVLVCLAGAVVLGSAAAFLPAWRAATIPPMMAMRAAEARS